MDKKRFAVRFEFTATAEGRCPTDALAHAAYKLQYAFEDARNISLKACSEIREKRAIAEAPFADQVTVHTEEPAAAPFPEITLLAPDEPSSHEDGSGLPPVLTQTAELTSAFTTPDPNDIPF